MNGQPCQNSGCLNTIVDRSEEHCRQCGEPVAVDPETGRACRGLGQPAQPRSRFLRCACGARAIIASGYNAEAITERRIWRLAAHFGWLYDEDGAQCPVCAAKGTPHAG